MLLGQGTLFGQLLFRPGNDICLLTATTKFEPLNTKQNHLKFRWMGRGRFRLENRMPIWVDERVWVRIVLECFMFCEGDVPAAKSLW
jgi:hypothetical protein